jgi:hypothetical protein
VTMKRRDIKRNDLKRLIKYLEPIFSRVKSHEPFTHALLHLLLKNDISFKSILEVFTGIGGDTDLVRSLYQDSDWLKGDYSFTALLASLWGVDTVKRVEEVVQTLLVDPYGGCVVAKTGSDTSIVNDMGSKRVVQVRENVRNGRDNSIESVVLEACLTSLTVFDSPLVCEPTFHSHF